MLTTHLILCFIIDLNGFHSFKAVLRLFVAHITDVKGYIINFFPLFDGIQICPGDPPRMALAAIVWKGSFKTHSYVKTCPQIGINCRTRW